MPSENTYYSKPFYQEMLKTAKLLYGSEEGLDKLINFAIADLIRRVRKGEIAKKDVQEMPKI